MVRYNHSFRIFISTFNQKVLRVNDSIPIEVGANKRKVFKYQLKDNTGNNISDKNNIFGELTGLYWIWKNINFDSNDIIGFYHYNKGLKISKYKAINYFKKNNFKKAWVALPAGYIRDNPDEIVNQALIKVLREDYPLYYKVWLKLYNSHMEGNQCRPANMFITTGNEFEKYCTFLFSVCFKVEDLLKKHTTLNKNMQRYCAFIGERLLNVYLVANNCTVLSADIRYKKWYLKAARKIAAILKINKKGKMYKVLKQKWGYRSSYGRK